MPAVLPLLALLVLLGAAGCATRSGSSPAASTPPPSAAPPAPYMRVAHPDSNTVALQIAVRRFVPAGRRGPPIWLVGASHVGESNYFGELQKQLDRTGLVLFEGVGAKSKKMRFDPAEQTSVQHSLAASLGVLFQLEAIEYDRPNFRNSDLTIAQLQALMRNRPTEAGGGGSGAQELEDLLQVMDGSSFVGALLQAGLKIIASSP
ncbi:MAG TPA: hypothetical protein VNH84_11160, partial [Candidatus Saccharimonadales bacterium]|nr:hypothetical protein [Candidatus Saccharimonadales bacterium]